MKIAKKYELTGVLGKGKFGAVYQGKNVKTGELVAIKLEKTDQPHVLKHETAILNYLYAKSCRNIPPVYMYGIVDHYTYLIMPLYTHTLESGIPVNQFSQVMQCAIQILGNIHRHGVVHRDMKPENWMVKDRELVLIDFGLATFYIDDRGRHLPPCQKTNMIGTPKYASIRVHEGSEYSRRDDLISLAYIGLKLLRGDIWNVLGLESALDISSPSNVYLHQAKRLDRLLPACPEELAKYIESVYSLDYSETPDYDKLKSVFDERQTLKNDINDSASVSV
jgi:serine/threonine protein kinase